MLYIVLIFIGIVIVLVFVSSFLKPSEEKEYLPYIKKNSPMTEAEHIFYTVLKEVVEDRYLIIPQVHLSEIVQVEKYTKKWIGYFHSINQKSVDFVLFNKEDFSPFLAIELDDQTHKHSDRMERDSKVNRILNKVGIRIEHVKCGYSYDSKELSERIFPTSYQPVSR